MVIVAEKYVVIAQNVIKQGRTDIGSVVTYNKKVRSVNALFPVTLYTNNYNNK
jgi:hypothetical protein